MDDLRRRFASLDRSRAPDLWGEIELRAAALGSVERVAGVPVPIPVRSRGLSGRTAVVLLVAAALLVGLMAGAFIVGSRLIPPPPSPAPSPTALATATAEVTPSLPSTPTVTIGRFVSAGSLVEGRAFHSAVALSDGRVLVVGGQGSTDVTAGNMLDSIEVWNPVSGAFTASGQMRRATWGVQYFGPFVFRMTDGRALIIPKGCSCKPPPGSTPAQVWDPVVGVQPLEHLIVHADLFTATQLSSGKILIAAGTYDLVGGPAEVWDPLADAIEPTGPVGHVRYGAVATLLSDGRVLILGGINQGEEDPVREAEVWDEASGTFSTAFTFETGPGYAHPRGPGLFAVTLQDGRVLVLNEAGARVWDPIDNTLSEAGAFPEARSEFSVTLLADGRVLVAGGRPVIPDGRGPSIASTLLWSPSTGGFEPGPELSEARATHTATLLPDGRVLIVGGVSSGSAYPGLDTVALAEVWVPLPADGP